MGNPTNKTVTGTAYMWELLIANHLDQSLWSINQKYWAAVLSNLLHSFLEVHNCVAPFTSHGKLHEFGAKNSISWAQTGMFWLFHNKFYCLESHTEHRWRCSKLCIGQGEPAEALVECRGLFMAIFNLENA